MSNRTRSTRREVALVLIAGLIGFGGAGLGSYATIVTHREGAEEARQAEARAKRADVYASFLAVANRLKASADSVSETMYAFVYGGGGGDIYGPSYGDRTKPLNPYEDAASRRLVLNCMYGHRSGQGRARACAAFRQAYRTLRSNQRMLSDGLNDIYIYGTRSSVGAARRIVRIYGESFNLTGYESTEDDGFDGAYTGFRNVMCREVSADPRPTCEPADG